MRILFTVHGYKPAWRIGGPAVSVPALAEALVNQGHQVTVFTTNSNLDEVLDVVPNHPVDVDGVEVWYFDKQEPVQRLLPGISYFSKSLGLLYSPRMAAALASRTREFDLVHTHLPFIYPTLAAARAAFRYGKPLFYHQRGVFDPARLQFRAFKKRVYLRLIEIPTLKRATTLIALTEAEVASYRSLGVATPCSVVPNGIDPLQFDARAESGALPRFGISAEHTVVVFMSRVHPVKGADKLIEAFLGLATAYPQALLVVAGPDEFGLEASLRGRVAAAGLDRRVVFPGMVTGEDKIALLKRADLFCLPSVAEGFSMAILEAMAANTCVLISAGCHFAEVVQHDAGVIAAVDTTALTSALADLLRDRARLRRMGLNGGRLVREKYTWPRVAARMSETYQEGVARHRSVERAARR